MRQNQLLHIQLRDVNLTEGYIDLRLEGSKTHREWRVPVVKQLRLRLQLLLTRATEAGAGPKDNLFDVSFTLPGKAKFDRNDVTVMHQKIRSFFAVCQRNVVLPFRRTVSDIPATELMKAPERNLQLVKDLLGHRSVSTTMEYVELKMDIVGKHWKKNCPCTDLCVERNYNY